MPFHYLQILVESAWAASIIPGASEATFAAMKAFGGFNLELAAALSAMGSIIGQLFNWGVGKLLLKLKYSGSFKMSEPLYIKTQTFFNKYFLFVLLLFSWAPLFNIFTVAAGFLAVPLRIALPLLAIGNAVFYGVSIL